MTRPPDCGAVQDTVICPSPAVAEQLATGPGVVIELDGVIIEDCVEGIPVPPPLVPDIVSMYDISFVKPVIMVFVGVEFTLKTSVVPELGVAVMTYPVAVPPVSDGVQYNLILAFPASTLVMDGCPGGGVAGVGVTCDEDTDAILFPVAFSAITVNVYGQ